MSPGAFPVGTLPSSPEEFEDAKKNARKRREPTINCCPWPGCKMSFNSNNSWDVCGKKIVFPGQEKLAFKDPREHVEFEHLELSMEWGDLKACLPHELAKYWYCVVE
jgi:hypothetical protein